MATIEGIPFHQAIIYPNGINVPNKSNKKKWIVVHETENKNPGADAWAHNRFIKNGGGKDKVSFTFSVDSKCIVQNLTLEQVGWQAGDGPNGTGNLYGIAIEMCENEPGERAIVEANTQALIRWIMQQTGIPISGVKPHKFFSGKNCPNDLLPRWDNFIAGISRVSQVSKKQGWQFENTKWLFYKNGQKAIGWLKDGERWYYLDANGIMQTGWVKVNNKWYLLSGITKGDIKQGQMLTGWQGDGGQSYYLDNTGAMLTGWFKVDDVWYYANDKGHMQRSTLVLGKDGKWYALGKDGKMLANTNISVDSKGILNI